jgi:predicted ATPase
MRLPSPPCSDATGRHPVLVLEGMPGAGKTTAATTLATENRIVVGEYTTMTGDVIPIEAHPTVDDDAGHQYNWLRKHHQVQSGCCYSPVFCDRDWLSALAYAYSVTDGGDLLTSRAGWVSNCLDRKALTLASTYVVFQLDPRVSLHRRAGRLTPGHPWSSRPGLVRLATFYTDPVEVLAPVHPDLAARLRTATWHPLRDYSLDRTVRFLRDLADRP